jgi:hypothetical protein
VKEPSGVEVGQGSRGGSGRFCINRCVGGCALRGSTRQGFAGTLGSDILLSLERVRQSGIAALGGGRHHIALLLGELIGLDGGEGGVGGGSQGVVIRGLGGGSRGARHGGIAQ